MFKNIKVLSKQNWKSVIVKLYSSTQESDDKIILNMPIGLIINKIQNGFDDNVTFDGNRFNIAEYTHIQEFVLFYSKELINEELEYWNQELLNRKQELVSIIKMLKNNQNSKRCILNFWDKKYFNEDAVSSCILNIAFLVKNEKLDMYITFRSNNLFKNFLIDCLFLNALHKYVAKKSNLDIGNKYITIYFGCLFQKDVKFIKKCIIK